MMNQLPRHAAARFVLSAVFFLSVSALFHPAFAQTTCTSLGSGSWGNTGTWDCGIVPDGNDVVDIVNGHQISFSQNREAGELNTNDGILAPVTNPNLTLTVTNTNGRSGNLTIGTSGTLQFGGGFGVTSADLEIAGDFTINGSGAFNVTDRVVTFNGGQIQNIIGTFGNINSFDAAVTITSGTTVQPSTDVDFERNLTVEGTYDAQTNGVVTTLAAIGQSMVLAGTPDALDFDTVILDGAVTIDVDVSTAGQVVIADLQGIRGNLEIGDTNSPVVQVEGSSTSTSVAGNFIMNNSSVLTLDGPTTGADDPEDSTEPFVVNGGTNVLDASTLTLSNKAGGGLTTSRGLRAEGILNANDRTVTISSTFNPRLRGNALTIHTLEFGGSASTIETDVTITNQITSSVPLEVTSVNTLTLASGSASPAAVLEDDFTIDGSLVVNGNEVEFAPGSSTTAVLSTSGTSVDFGSLTHSGPGTVQLDDPITVSGDLTVDGPITGSTITMDSGLPSTNINALSVSIPSLTITNGTTVTTSGLGGGGRTLTIDAVTINGGATLTGGGDDTNLDINGDVDITDGSFNLSTNTTADPLYSVAGDFLLNASNGTFTANERTVALDGSSAQTIGTGSTEQGPTFFDLEINNSNGVAANASLTDDVEITHNLILTDGAFATNGKLTLLSTFDGTDITDAAVDQGGSGTLTSSGDTAQRVVDGTASGITGNSNTGTLGDDAGWRSLGIPFSSTNLTGSALIDTDDNNPIPVELPSAGGDMILQWDATNNQYLSPPDVGETAGSLPLSQGEGFLLFFFDDDLDDIDNDGLTVTADGELPGFGSAFSTTVDVDGANSGTGDSGFLFIANPYPAAYDLSVATLSDGTNTDNLNTLNPEVYDDDANTGSGGFVTRTTVASWQGFFIDVSSANVSGSSVTLTFPLSGIVSGTASDNIFELAPSDADPILGVRLQKETQSGSLPGPGQPVEIVDGVSLDFRDDATATYDAFDVRKLMMPTTVGSRTGETIGLETSLLAIETARNGATTFLKRDARPVPASSDDYPIVYNLAFDCANLDGETTYTIDVGDAENIDPSWGVLLRDTHTGNESTLYTGGASVETYSFSVTAEQCGSTVGDDGPPASSSLVYDGSLTEANASPDAVTGSRFQLLVGPSETLPVELDELKGSADGQDVVLEWSTLSETNNAGFQVQQQRDGAFADLENAFVEGAGTTDQPQAYRFRVEDVSPGTHTFRLKQVDVDGSTTVTDPLDVTVGLAGQFQLSAYPNPFQGRATVEFAVKDAQPVTIELYNTLGQRVRTVYQGPARAEETVRKTLDGSGLSSGLYIIRLKGEGFTATKKITLVR